MRSFSDPLRRALAVAPHHPAVIDGATELTYAELADRVARLQQALSGLGVVPGDRVALLMANGHRYVEAYLALPAIGVLIVPLNARLADAELEYICADAGVSALITDRGPSALDGLVGRVIRVPDAYDELVAAATLPDEGTDAADRSLDEVAGLFYTGGTTGPAKGVMLTHGNLVANAWNALTSCGLRADDRYLVMAPMFHAAGTVSVLGCVALGATQVTVPAFDPTLVLDTIEREGITNTLAVPTMMAALVEEQARAPRDVSSLRMMTHGASPVAVETLRRFRTLFPAAELVHLYGATELAPLAAAFADEHRELDGPRARSCGQAVLGCRVAVVDSQRRPLPIGEVGEVAVSGANVMAGYWDKPDQTAAALHEGWYLTGDLGRLDDEGYLFLVDRAKDMIVTGGENVYCSEVEQALSTHPAVLECAVYGIPDDRWGEAVAASAVLRASSEGVPVATEDDLRRHCRELIAGFKVPKRIEISAEPLPKSAAGKILKRELREPFWQGRSERVGGA